MPSPCPWLCHLTRTWGPKKGYNWERPAEGIPTSTPGPVLPPTPSGTLASTASVPSAREQCQGRVLVEELRPARAPKMLAQGCLSHCMSHASPYRDNDAPVKTVSQAAVVTASPLRG